MCQITEIYYFSPFPSLSFSLITESDIAKLSKLNDTTKTENNFIINISHKDTMQDESLVGYEHWNEWGMLLTQDKIKYSIVSRVPVHI